MKSQFKMIIVMMLLFSVTACSSLPEELSSNSEQVLTDYPTFAMAQGQASSDVRLGGVIASVSNQSSKTRLEIVNLPIGSDGKPDIKQEPDGRFYVYVDQYLEPMSYDEGRLITVIGKAGGEEEGNVGDYEYIFPVINETGHRLWQIEEKVRAYDSFTHDYYHCYSRSCRRFLTAPFPSEGKIIKQVK